MNTIASFDRRMATLGLLGLRPKSGLSVKALAHLSGVSISETQLILRDLESKKLVLKQKTDQGTSVFTSALHGLPDPQVLDLLRRPMIVNFEVTDRVVQAALKSLAELPGLPDTIEAKPASTSSPIFPLFSYLSFQDRTDPDREAIVAGILVKRLVPEAYEITAELCGDESGTIWRELTPRKVEADGIALIQAAGDLARELARDGEALITALASFAVEGKGECV